MVPPERGRWLPRQSRQPGPAESATTPQNKKAAVVPEKETLAQGECMRELKGLKEGPPPGQQGPGSHWQTGPSLTENG